MESGRAPSTLLSRYFAEVRGSPRLTNEEERGLGRSVSRGDRDALNALIESNLSFAVKVAREYRNLGLPLEDLINEANLGLIQAAHRYDSTKGTRSSPTRSGESASPPESPQRAFHRGP
jgi:RNA polymerase primary sigma factor